MKAVVALASVFGAACVFVGVTGSGTAVADPVSLTLTYKCPFPLIDTQPISVHITSDIPKTIAANSPAPKIVVDTTTALNDETTTGLNMVGATTIEGTGESLSTVEAPQGDMPVTVPVTVQKTAVPGSGGFSVKAGGTAPAIQFSKEGPAKIVVGGLKLTLSPKDADGNLTSLGTFDSTCTQDPGQNNQLATFTVGPGGPGDPGDPTDTVAPTKPGTPTVTAKTATSVSLAWPASTDATGVTGYDVFNGTTLMGTATTASAAIANLTAATAYNFTVVAKDAAGNVSPASEPLAVTTDAAGTVQPPPAGGGAQAGCGALEPPPGVKVNSKGCTFMAGFANVNKLKGATAINDPARGEQVLTNIIVSTKAAPGELQFHADFQFLKPLLTKATFLTFGIMPTTATMEMTQVGIGTLDGASPLPAAKSFKLNAKAKISVRIFDVKVNGAPLNVGPNCKTAEPAEVALAGGTPEYKSILAGGPLRGDMTIPAFSGCGVGEDLDRIFTSSVSGSGNYIKIVQGKICLPAATTPCPPVAPVR